MPLRFRRTVKILPGLKINLSKSGISTSVGRPGATVNFSKKGVKQTVGLPGTGLSYSTLTTQSKSKPKPVRSQNGKGTGLLGCLFMPFQMMIDLIKSIINPETRRSSLVLVSIIGGLFVLISGVSSVSGLINEARNTPTPTIDLVALNVAALNAAWQPYTLTAAALPTATVPSATPTETETPSPTITPLPTFTLGPTNTATLIPYYPPTLANVPPPSGGSGGSCCKVCTNSKACGDSCISKDKTCHQPTGCACDG